MSRRTRTRFQRIAAASYIAVMGFVAVSAGSADAGTGPICENNEEPVCEPPAPPQQRFRLVVVSTTADSF